MSRRKKGIPLAPVFRDRVKGLARLPAARIETAANNFRTHDDHQRTALDGLLVEIGIAGAAVAWVPDAKARAALRKVDGPEAFATWLAGYAGPVRLIDGHLRRERLAAQGQPVLVTDLDEREASKALATFDAVSDLAGVDAALLASLLEDVGSPEEDGTATLLDELQRHLPKAPPPAPTIIDCPTVPDEDRSGSSPWGRIRAAGGIYVRIGEHEGSVLPEVHAKIIAAITALGGPPRQAIGRWLESLFP